jgi:hypothetical protein
MHMDTTYSGVRAIGVPLKKALTAMTRIQVATFLYTVISILFSKSNCLLPNFNKKVVFFLLKVW